MALVVTTTGAAPEPCDKDLAIEQIEMVQEFPNLLSYGLLKPSALGFAPR